MIQITTTYRDVTVTTGDGTRSCLGPGPADALLRRPIYGSALDDKQSKKRGGSSMANMESLARSMANEELPARSVLITLGHHTAFAATLLRT